MAITIPPKINPIANQENGGRVTNRSPHNERITDNTKSLRLASNIDTLVLSIDIKWKDILFFEYLTEIKTEALAAGKEQKIIIINNESPEPFIFNIKEHGAKGYEWLLNNNEYSLRIGNWTDPKTMPSVVATVRSETLWRIGVENAVNRLLQILENSGAFIITKKLSRIDLCLDLLMPESDWTKDLIDYQVTQSKYSAQHLHNKKLTGISFGKGRIAARLYDKPLEIVQQSKKYWLYDIWGLNTVPEGYKIIRIEFQIRREIIKELGLNQVSDLFKKSSNIWAYCTKKWLQFKDNPGKHQVLQRKTLEWWKEVQNGFQDINNAYPLIRCKASDADEDKLLSQLFGMWTSLEALKSETKQISLDQKINMKESLNYLFNLANSKEKDETEFNKNILNKRAKYQRLEEKSREVKVQRRQQKL